MKNAKRKVALRPREQKGAALVISLGVLTLLIILAMGMTASMLYEERTARAYDNDILARYAAEAGLNNAVLELQKKARFFYRDTTTQPWYSGYTYTDNFTAYTTIAAVHIYDCGSRIYINDRASSLTTYAPPPEWPGGGYPPESNDKSRKRILENLYSILGFSANKADDLYDEMDTNGPYRSLDEIIKRTSTRANPTTYADLYNYPPNYNPGNARLKQLRPLHEYITLYSFRDPTTIKVNDITNPCYEKDPRAPININTAERFVIEAVCRRLLAYHACPKCGGDGRITYQLWPGVNNDLCTDCYANPVNAMLTGALEITNQEAAYLSDWIVTNRPFASYQDLYVRLKGACAGNPDCDGDSTVVPVGKQDADLVLANFNPNPGYTPGTRELGWAEKEGFLHKLRDIRNSVGAPPGDNRPGLAQNTTEFSFNSGGYYLLVSAAGVYATSSNVLLATKTYETYVKIFDQVVKSTQNEFDGGTFGTTTSYPEPKAIAGINSANYDGYLMRQHIINNLPNDPLLPHLLVCFDQPSLVANSGGNVNANINPVNTTNSSTTALADSVNPGTVLVDGGLFTKRNRQQLAYKCQDNMLGKTGTVYFWYKNLFNADDNHNYGYSGGEVEKSLFWAWEQPNVQRYMPFFGDHDTPPNWQVGHWTADLSNVWWQYMDKSLPTPLNPPIQDVAGWPPGGQGRQFMQVWQYNVSAGGTHQAAAIATLGCGHQSGTTATGWAWMRISQDGFERPAPTYVKRGTWSHIAITWNDRGFGFTNYPASNYLLNTDWVHTGPSPEGAIPGHNLPQFNGDTSGSMNFANREIRLYIDGTEITQANWGFAGWGFMQFAQAFANGAEMCIGYKGEFVCQYAEGIIDQLQVWDTEYDAASVMNERNIGRFQPAAIYTSPKMTTKNNNDSWGCVYWSHYIPTGAPALTVNVSDTGLGGWAGTFGDPNLNTFEGSLDSTKIGGVVLGNDFYYKVTFNNRAMPVLNSEVFDDIRVTIIRNPEFYNYKEVMQ
jgi:hypothetical protein